MLEEHHSGSKMQASRPAHMWLDARLALSQRSSRFTLPMNMRDLETMSPLDYLINYCIVSPRRESLYHKIFYKHKENKTNLIAFKALAKALGDVLIHTITPLHTRNLYKMLDIDEETNVDYKQFSGIAAFAERILYPKFVTVDTADIPDYQRDLIECADFHCLKWKLAGLHPNRKVKKMLETLGST